ncbi:MAG: hypothetical protein SO047_04085 [Ruminococcus bovis]|nr:hypothetical protein [Ruminococcus bovis]MDY3662042.1 hypothetical protein [Ruminococcus bovis]
MKNLMCLVTVLMMISMFAFSINSFSADEVDNQDTSIVTNENNAENYGEDKVLLTDDIEGDATVDEATDDEMAYSSGNLAPKESTSDEVGSEMSSPKTSDTDTYTAVVLALLFGSVASVAVYKLKK